jgi:alcohol dehydrogenase
MRRHSLLLVAARRLDWVEEDLPEPGPSELLVRTVAGAVSVGTELPLYLGTHCGTYPARYPRMTGYESLAEVVAAGAAVAGIAAGDRVVAFYGHRTYAVIPAERAIHVPAGIAAPVALLAILSCDVAKGIGKAAPGQGEPILVTGGGTIGLLTAFNLVARGHTQVDLVEPLPERRSLALALGIRAALSPEEAEAIDVAYQVGFECSGRDRAFHLLQQKLVPCGRICVLSDGNVEPLTLAPAFHEKELAVSGSSDGMDYQGHAAWFFERARTRAPALERLFEWRVAASEVPAAFERMAAGPTPIKVLVSYLQWGWYGADVRRE